MNTLCGRTASILANLAVPYLTRPVHHLPCGRWDMFTVLILFFCSVMIPFNVCFKWNPLEIKILNYLVDSE